MRHLLTVSLIGVVILGAGVWIGGALKEAACVPLYPPSAGKIGLGV